MPADRDALLLALMLPVLRWAQSYEAGLVHCGTMNPQLHSYDRHRTICTAEDKATASRLGGHSWNIISNNDQERKVTLKVWLWVMAQNDWSSKTDPFSKCQYWMWRRLWSEFENERHLSICYVSNSASHQVLYLMARMRSTSATPGHLGLPIRRATHVFNHVLFWASKHPPPSKFELSSVRSSDHYVNNAGETTSVWFDRRCRIPHPMGGLEGSNWSANVRESLRCPATPQRHLERKHPHGDNLGSHSN